MAVKYIQKNKNGLWAISNSKAGKVLRTTNTQKEAIAIAGSTKTTEGIMIKRASGWTAATGWDQQVANSTKSKTTLKEDRIQKTEWAEKPTAKKAPAKKTTTKKAPAKKAEPKKAAAKKTVSKKTPVKKAAPKKAVAKKTVAKKAPAKKAAPKKVVAAKPEAKKRQTQKIEVLKVETSANQKHKKGLPAWAGLLIGLSIIGIVVGGAFLLGYYL